MRKGLLIFSAVGLGCLFRPELHHEHTDPNTLRSRAGGLIQLGKRSTALCWEVRVRAGSITSTFAALPSLACSSQPRYAMARLRTNLGGGPHMYFPKSFRWTESFVLILGLLLVGHASAQDRPSLHNRLTNQDVISMVQLELSDDVIIAKIRAAAAKGADAVSFDTSADGLRALKAANVPDTVIKAMINPIPATSVVFAGAGAISTDPNLPPPEVGVYWKDGAKFILIQSRTLTQAKVGGRAGSFFTDGMRSEHWDATIDGPTSLNRLKDRRPVFYFYVADGVTASDYVLIKLEKKNDRREFQVGSFGGVTGGKSGVKKEKEIPYAAEHIGIRTYRITLDSDLKPGEYAFFMGTGQQATMASGRGSARSGGSATGRIYDFTIPE